MQVETLERTLGCRLPRDYRKFLLEQPEYAPGWLNELYSVEDVARNLELHRSLPGFPTHLLPVGDDGLGNSVYLSLESGEILFLDHESDEGLKTQARSFRAFLNRLERQGDSDSALATESLQRDVVALIKRGDLPAVKSLLKKRRRGLFRLVEAAIDADQREILEFLLERRFPLGNALFSAARAGDLALVQRLVSLGARVNQPYRVDYGAHPWKGRIALHHARTEEICRYLIEQGSNLSARDRAGDTPLYSPANYYFDRPEKIPEPWREPQGR